MKLLTGLLIAVSGISFIACTSIAISDDTYDSRISMAGGHRFKLYFKIVKL